MDLKEFKQYCVDYLSKYGRPVWVWGEWNGIEGFEGKGGIGSAVVIWITERPAFPLGKFPDARDVQFYKLLEEYGLNNIHLTDFVKVAGKSGEPPSEEMLKDCEHLMKKEIELIKDLNKSDNKNLIIVANHRNVEKWMKQYPSKYRLRYVPFFKFCMRFKKMDILRRALSEIRAEAGIS